MSTKAEASTELAKLVSTDLAKVQERLRKATAQRDDLASRLAKVTAAYNELLRRAAPAKGVLRAVPKTP